MTYNIIDLFLIFIFLLTIVVSCTRKFNIATIRTSIVEIGQLIALFVSSIISFNILEKFKIIEKIISLILVESSDIINNFGWFPFLLTIGVYIAITTIIYFILKLMLIIIVKLLVNPLLNLINKRERSSKLILGKLIVIIFSIPKAGFYTFILFLVVNIVGGSGILGNGITDKVLSSRNRLLIARNTLPERVINYSVPIKNNEEVAVASSRIENKNNNSKVNIINLYNGVTIEDGVKSNIEIDFMAENIVKDITSEKQKAKVLYEWIGNNIKYDEDKARIIDNNGHNIDSGAISAMSTRSGVCFDYSCLYVAMANKVGLKTRLIVGDAFNGKEWTPHAWNEVYIQSEGRWIGVDTTFAKGGNYFDNKTFNETHKSEEIVGEWK